MLRPGLVPSTELLTALSLTAKQFEIGLDLADEPGGITREVIEAKYQPTNAEVAELAERGFIEQKDGHLLTTAMGSGLLHAIADFIAAS